MNNINAKNPSSIDPLDLFLEMDPDQNEFDQLFLPPLTDTEQLELDEILNSLVSPIEPDLTQMRPCYNDIASCHRNASEERNEDWSTMGCANSGSQMNYLIGATSTTTLHSLSSPSNNATNVSTGENAYSKESAMFPDVTADSSVANSSVAESVGPSSMALRNLSNVENSRTEKRHESRRTHLERKSQDNLRYNTKLSRLYREINSLVNLIEGQRRRSKPQILTAVIRILKNQLETRHFRRRR